MGDGLKLSKDKRHRSSSSLAGVMIEGTRSERKLDIRASIPEVDDQFASAEAKCNDLQEKIDLVKVLKKKRKLKKRSTTKIMDPPPLSENIPFITVHTQPKKKVSQQAARLRRFDVPPHPTRGYLDPATVEQHRMIGQVRGSSQNKPVNEAAEQQPARTRHLRRARADGDVMNWCEGTRGQGVQITTDPLEVACGADEALDDFSDCDYYDDRRYEVSQTIPCQTKKGTNARYQNKVSPMRRRHVPKETMEKEDSKKIEDTREDQNKWGASSAHNKHHPNIGRGQQNGAPPYKEERPVVELFSKVANRSGQPGPAARPIASPERKFRRKNTVREPSVMHDMDEHKTGPLRDEPPTEAKKEVHRHPRRVKYRSRRYELPTVASQMKQAGVRHYYDTGNVSTIPFVVSKSTAPSHNIGVNIQQVLNGVKIQQPLSGIPLTIAHHMGLGHIPTYGARNLMTQPSLDNHEINVIRVGRKLLRLPSYRYMSYNRLLSLYRESDGMVSRFLKAISRPHYFYTSMYNLVTNREDADATSKGRASNQEAKQSLAEYATLYREYQKLEKLIEEGNYDPELERRKEELSSELAAREDHIRRVVQEYRTSDEQVPLRASASTAEDAYRHSTFKLNPEQQ